MTGCGRNVEWVKARADARWKELGYTAIGYEGYLWSPFCGGDVWYLLKRDDTPGVIYTASLCRRWDELHVYELSVVSGQQLNHQGEIK
jgi:hypothetical protein